MHDSNQTAASSVEPFGELVRDALKSIGEDEPVAAEPDALTPGDEPVTAEPDALTPGDEPVTVEPDAPAPLDEATTSAPTRVLVRLAGGELIEAGSFASPAEARARGEELAAQLAASNGPWPFVGWGFLRPELVVAVQLDPPA
jgi:hypothetical protein